MKRSFDRYRSLGGSLLLPPTRGRLAIGLAIAVLGPLAIGPWLPSGALSLFPALPFMLIVVLATVFGRLLAAGVAIVVSVVTLDSLVIERVSTEGRTQQEIWAIVTFVLVAAIVVQLLVRLDRTLSMEIRERSRLRFLSRAGDAMSVSLDLDETLHRLGDVLVPELADWFSVDLLEGTEIRNVLVMHPDPEMVALARDLQRRFPTDPHAPTGVPNVIRTGAAELTETISDEMLKALIDDPELLEVMRGLHLRCAMIVPLTARGRTFGSLTLIGADHHERYTNDDLQLAEEIADRAALAIDTARLFHAEHDARARALEEAHRSEVLKDVTAAFGRAVTVEEVMTALLEDGIRRAGAAAGTVGLLGPDGVVEVLGLTGYEPDDGPYWHSFRTSDPLPLSDAIATREPVVLSTTEERDRRYPELRGRGEQRDHALACLPLLLGGEAIGGFSASYPPETGLGADDLSFLSALGEQCAQAIDRARARDRAVRTRSRFDALASASQSLATSLDLDRTAQIVVGIGADTLGRRAALYVRDRGQLRLLGAHGVAADDAGPPSTELARRIDRAIAAREPLVDDRSVILPLAIAGSVVGGLVIEEPTIDVHDPDDLGFGIEIARRMARSLENARLYRERDYVARTLQRSLLPPTLAEIPGLDVDALFRPALSGYDVGGDFYDVFEIDHGRWLAVVGDVCGKGIEAAALTGLARHTLRATADVRSPSEALLSLNRALLREQLDGRFVTVALVLIDPVGGDGMTARVSVGGHPLPQRVGSDGSIQPVGHYGTLLGVMEKIHLDDVTVQLDPGDAIVLFTDGLLGKRETSAVHPSWLDASLGNGSVGSAREIRDAVERYVDTLPEQMDDIALLVLRVPTG